MKQYEKRWNILGYLVIGAFLSPLDYFIVNMALPAIQKAFTATDDQLQMVVAIYGLTYAALVVCGGKLGDIYGRKKVFTTGLWIFLVASLACAFSPTIVLLIISRFLQGIGASLLAPQVLASIRILFTSDEQTKAMGFFGSVFGLASIVGQLLGGLLLNFNIGGYTWQLVFLVNVPVALVCLYGIYKTMPEEQVAVDKTLDVLEVALVIVSLLGFITPLIYGRHFNWAWWIFALIGLSVVIGIAFVKYEQYRERMKMPCLLAMSMFNARDFTSKLPIILLYNFTAGLFICYPYYLQSYLHWSALAAGLAIVPYGIGFFIGPISYAKLPLTPAIWIRTGLLLLGISFSTLAFLFATFEIPTFSIAIVFVFAGFGHGILMPVMMKEVMQDVKSHQVGQASGIVSTTIQVGSVLGGALIGTLFFALIDHFGTVVAFASSLASIGVVQLVSLVGYLGFYKQTKTT